MKKLTMKDVEGYDHIPEYLKDYTRKNPDNLSTIYPVEVYQKRKRYYDKFIRSIVPVCRQREIMIMSASDVSHTQRGYVIFNEDNFRFLETYRNLISQDYKLYMSCATFAFIPKFTNDLKVRSQETNAWYLKLAASSVTNYDILIDIDPQNGDFDQMIGQTVQILKTLDHFQIMYYIIPTGRAFQIVLKNNLISGMLQNNIMSLLRMLKFNYSFSCIDLAGCGILSKVMKVPYSLNGEIACVPLPRSTIQNLSGKTKKDYLKAFDSDNVLIMCPGDRGIVWMNEDEKFYTNRLFALSRFLVEGYYDLTKRGEIDES